MFKQSTLTKFLWAINYGQLNHYLTGKQVTAYPALFIHKRSEMNECAIARGLKSGKPQFILMRNLFAKIRTTCCTA